MSSSSYNNCIQSSWYTIVLFQCIVCNTLQSSTPVTKSSNNKLLHQRWYEYWTSTCWQLEFCLLLSYDFCNFLLLILFDIRQNVVLRQFQAEARYLFKKSFWLTWQTDFVFSRNRSEKYQPLGQASKDLWGKSPKMCYAYQSNNFQCQNGSDKKLEEYLGGIVRLGMTQNWTAAL